MDQIRGLYDDDEEEQVGGEGEEGNVMNNDEDSYKIHSDKKEGIKGSEGLGQGQGENEEKRSNKIRRMGVIYFVPRNSGVITTSEHANEINQENNVHTVRSNSDNNDLIVSKIVHINGNNAITVIPDLDLSSFEDEEEVPGGTIPGLGMISYIVDDEDKVIRACALRTIVVSTCMCQW